MCALAANRFLEPHDEPALRRVLHAVRVDDGREDARQRQLTGPGRWTLERTGEGGVAQRPGPGAHAQLEQLGRKANRVLGIALGEQALDRELEVVELVEAEVE